MRTVILWKTLIVVTMLSASAQSQPNKRSIAVSFSIDGTPAHCDGFQVELRLNGESIKPEQTGQRFEIPDVFKGPCQQVERRPARRHRPDLQPLYALKEYGYTHEFDHGAWLGYLIFEGEP